MLVKTFGMAVFGIDATTITIEVDVTTGIKFLLVGFLEDIGFVNIRECNFNDCEDSMFNLVEDKERFTECIAIECRK